MRPTLVRVQFVVTTLMLLVATACAPALSPITANLIASEPAGPLMLAAQLESGAAQGPPSGWTGCANQNEIPFEECQALVALYHTTRGPEWWFNEGWLTTATPCSWAGVTCADGQHVTELNLFGNNLNGPLPPGLGNLTHLTLLDMSYNSISNDIPPQLGNLSNLQELRLAGNQLTGEIPPSLGNLDSLTVLTLESNNLSGPLPPELGNLTNLTSLEVSFNKLNGSIPPSFGNLTNLTTLYLSGNRLTGSIPPELGNLTNLVWLTLDYNRLSGPIPAELGNLIELYALGVSGNALGGDIPPELANLTNLNELYLDYNMLTASDPALLSFLDSLTPRWIYTQTIPPTDLSLIAMGSDYVELSWTPIPFTDTQYGGFYEVSYAGDMSGPWHVAGTTSDKLATGFIVDGLKPGQQYYFRVRTFTPAHDYQVNALWSEYTAPVGAVTPGQQSAAPASFIAVMAVPGGFLHARIPYTVTTAEWVAARRGSARE